MAKRSRRNRKRRQKTADFTPKIESVQEKSPTPEPVSSYEVEEHEFMEEYYYVFHELRNVLMITVVMYGVLFGLAYVI